MKIVLHRDRDFMMPDEADAFSKPYTDKSIAVWLTQHSDMESYWGDKNVIKAHFGIDDAAAEELLSAAVREGQTNNADSECRNRKRHTIRNQPPLRNIVEKGELGAVSDADVAIAYCNNGFQHLILGKTLSEKIRAQAQRQQLRGYQGFGKSLPVGMNTKVAKDLEAILEQQLK